MLNALRGPDRSPSSLEDVKRALACRGRAESRALPAQVRDVSVVGSREERR